MQLWDWNKDKCLIFIDKNFPSNISFPYLRAGEKGNHELCGLKGMAVAFLVYSLLPAGSEWLTAVTICNKRLDYFAMPQEAHSVWKKCLSGGEEQFIKSPSCNAWVCQVACAQAFFKKTYNLITKLNLDPLWWNLVFISSGANGKPMSAYSISPSWSVGMKLKKNCTPRYPNFIQVEEIHPHFRRNDRLTPGLQQPICPACIPPQ